MNCRQTKRIKKIPHFVYLLKDGDCVVYVGCTKNLKNRMGNHKSKPHNNVEIFKFADKMKALMYERMMLIKYRPKHNWMPPHLIKEPKQ